MGANSRRKAAPGRVISKRFVPGMRYPQASRGGRSCLCCASVILDGCSCSFRRGCGQHVGGACLTGQGWRALPAFGWVQTATGSLRLGRCPVAVYTKYAANPAPRISRGRGLCCASVILDGYGCSFWRSCWQRVAVPALLGVDGARLACLWTGANGHREPALGGCTLWQFVPGMRQAPPHAFRGGGACVCASVIPGRLWQAGVASGAGANVLATSSRRCA